MFWQFWLAIRFVCHCCDSNSFTFQLFLMWFQCYPVWEIFSHLFLCFVRFHFSFNFRSHTLRKCCYENVVIVVAENEKQKKSVLWQPKHHNTKQQHAQKNWTYHLNSACYMLVHVFTNEKSLVVNVNPELHLIQFFSLARSLTSTINSSSKNTKQNSEHKKTREKEISRK